MNSLDERAANGRLIHLRKCLDDAIRERAAADQHAKFLLRKIAYLRRDMRQLGMEEET